MTSQQTFTCSKSTRETLEVDVVLVSLFFTIAALNKKMFIWIASSDYETISIYIIYFQIIKLCWSIIVWNNKHWNVPERSNFLLLLECYMRNNLACLGGYPTHLDVSDMSNLFYFHFVFTWSRAMTRLLTEIQFCQPGETVMWMLIYQFKLTKLVFIMWLWSCV